MECDPGLGGLKDFFRTESGTLIPLEEPAGNPAEDQMVQPNAQQHLGYLAKLLSQDGTSQSYLARLVAAEAGHPLASDVQTAESESQQTKLADAAYQLGDNSLENYGRQQCYDRVQASSNPEAEFAMLQSELALLTPAASETAAPEPHHLRVEVSGAGCARVNGVYTYLEDYGEHPLYRCERTGLELWWNDEWRIGKTCDYYYTSQGLGGLEGEWALAGTNRNSAAVEPSPRVDKTSRTNARFVDGHMHALVHVEGSCAYPGQSNWFCDVCKAEKPDFLWHCGTCGDSGFDLCDKCMDSPNQELAWPQNSSYQELLVPVPLITTQLTECTQLAVPDGCVVAGISGLELLPAKISSTQDHIVWSWLQPNTLTSSVFFQNGIQPKSLRVSPPQPFAALTLRPLSVVCGYQDISGRYHPSEDCSGRPQWRGPHGAVLRYERTGSWGVDSWLKSACWVIFQGGHHRYGFVSNTLFPIGSAIWHTLCDAQGVVIEHKQDEVCISYCDDSSDHQTISHQQLHSLRRTARAQLAAAHEQLRLLDQLSPGNGGMSMFDDVCAAVCPMGQLFVDNHPHMLRRVLGSEQYAGETNWFCDLCKAKKPEYLWNCATCGKKPGFDLCDGCVDAAKARITRKLQITQALHGQSVPRAVFNWITDKTAVEPCAVGAWLDSMKCEYLCGSVCEAVRAAAAELCMESSPEALHGLVSDHCLQLRGVSTKDKSQQLRQAVAVCMLMAQLRARTSQYHTLECALAMCDETVLAKYAAEHEVLVPAMAAYASNWTLVTALFEQLAATDVMASDPGVRMACISSDLVEASEPCLVKAQECVDQLQAGTIHTAIVLITGSPNDLRPQCVMMTRTPSDEFEMVVVAAHNETVLTGANTTDVHTQSAQLNVHAFWATLLGHQLLSHSSRGGILAALADSSIPQFAVDMALRRWPRTDCQADVDWILANNKPLQEVGLLDVCTLYDGSYRGHILEAVDGVPLVQLRSVLQTHDKNCGHHALVNASLMLRACFCENVMEAAATLHQICDRAGFEERFEAHKQMLLQNAKDSGWNEDDIKAGDLFPNQAVWLGLMEPQLASFSGCITVIPDFFHSSVELVDQAQTVIDNLVAAQAGAHAFVLGAFNHWVCLVAFASGARGLRFFFLDSANTPYSATDKHVERQKMIKTLISAFTDAEKSLPGIMLEHVLEQFLGDLTSQTVNADGAMVGARGEDKEQACLERFALSGRPQRIEVEIVQRVRTLGADRIPEQARKVVSESVTQALDVLANSDPVEFGRTESLMCGDGEMWVNKLERSLLGLLEALNGVSRDPAVPVPAKVDLVASQEHVVSLCEFGFSADHAAYALIQKANQFDKALDMLLSTSGEEMQSSIDAEAIAKLEAQEAAEAEANGEVAEVELQSPHVPNT